MSRTTKHHLSTALLVSLAVPIAVLAFVIAGYAASTAPNWGELGTVGTVVGGLVAYLSASLALTPSRKAHA